MKSENAHKILVIVPAYNEEAAIARTVETLRSVPNVDIFVVNDGSVDATPFILDQIGVPHVDLIMNLGIGAAVQTGYKYALAQGYGAAVQFDGDGQHDASCIERITRPVLSGEADIVVGSRFVDNSSDFKSSFMRRFGIRVLSLALKISTGATLRDVTSGFRAMGPKAIELFSRKYPADYPEPESLAMALSRGMRVQEVGVAMHPRTTGTSSIKLLNSVYYMIKVTLAIFIASPRQKGPRA